MPTSVHLPRWFLPGASLLAVVLVFTLVEPIPQPAAYFDFADDRRVFGVSNFWNVVTNLAFLWPGFLGIYCLLGDNSLRVMPELRVIYLVLFIGISLTAFGSAWFHYAPANQTLVWDRLPMTIVFMSLFAAVVAEFISRKLGRTLFLLLLMLGMLSVAYWSWTEARGIGDLRAYALVQFLPMILIPAIVVLYKSPYDHNGYLFGLYGYYALAKLAEFLDRPIYSVGELLSGHSIKHLLAAGAALILLRGLQTRQLVTANSRG